MQVRIFAGFWCMCLLASCTPEQAADLARLPAASEPFSTQRGAPPLRARLTGPDDVVNGQQLDLVVQLDRTAAFDQPVAATLTLPQGVRLAPGSDKGAQTFVRQAADRELRYTVNVERVPSEDVVVTLDAQGVGAGYHAELRYRFGRAAPAQQAAITTGPSVRVGQRELGPAVRVEGRATE
jgi:hypothetical protein